jgi:hypothetical protein
MFYAFALVTGDATKKTPFPLFFLRYSLFAVLYPTGITGELTVFFKAAVDPGFPGADYGTAVVSFVNFFYSKFLPAIYALGSPFMIMNMAGNRKSAFKKRFEKPPPPARGISFPIDDPKTGSRSSTPVNKEILAAAVGAVNPQKADKIRTARGYRFTYVKHLVGLVEEQCKSPEDCLKIAQAGLDKAYELFEFVAPDGTAVSLKEAMAAKNNEKFHTGYIKGEGVQNATGLEIPYKGKTLKGEELKEQVRKWVNYGTIEPSAGEAIIGCVDNPKWCELADKYFVLLGAGSAMGPLHVLLALGANVIAVDLDRPFIWKRLIELAKKSTGSITFPLTQEQKSLLTDDDLYGCAGCNLFTHTPMIRDWLMDLYKGKAFTVGSYAYLNGALHVQVSLAMDAITKDLSEKRPNTSLAYLCTPTDLHLVPEEAFRASEANYKEYSSRPLCESCLFAGGYATYRLYLTVLSSFPFHNRYHYEPSQSWQVPAKECSNHCFWSGWRLFLDQRRQCGTRPKLHSSQAHATLESYHRPQQGMHRIFEHRSGDFNRLCYSEPNLCLGLRRHAIL